MSLRLEMLQVARLSPKLLGESAALVESFVRSKLSANGGFAGRSGESDLYYTVFGLESLLALRADVPRAAVREYLRSFGDGEGLDFVHLACLARCWADVGQKPAELGRIAERIERFRTPDGGYNASATSEHGTAYACFLALGAYQDLGIEPPRPEEMLRCVEALRAGDGGYANQRDVPAGLTPPTAAAVTLLRHLGRRPDPALAHWLLARQHAEGGFYASPLAPIPDLLSTATALHALASLDADLEPIKESCLDFIDTLWNNSGGFCGSWSDDVRDCEYTYYALLALGHLSL